MNYLASDLCNGAPGAAHTQTPVIKALNIKG